MESYKLHKNFRKFLLNESANTEDICLYHHGAGKSNHESFVKRLGRDKGAFENMLKNRSRADFIERYQGL